MLLTLLGGPDASIEHRRAQSSLFAASQPPPPPGVRIEATELGGVAAERIVKEAGPPERTFLHLHGGGYVMGDPPGSRGLTTALALAAATFALGLLRRQDAADTFTAAVALAVGAFQPGAHGALGLRHRCGAHGAMGIAATAAGGQGVVCGHEGKLR